jgi:hypothetical protein
MTHLPYPDLLMILWLEFLKLEETLLKIPMTLIIIIPKLEPLITKTLLHIMIQFKILITCGKKNNQIYSLPLYNIKMIYSQAMQLL